MESIIRLLLAWVLSFVCALTLEASSRHISRLDSSSYDECESIELLSAAISLMIDFLARDCCFLVLVPSLIRAWTYLVIVLVFFAFGGILIPSSL